MNNVEQFLEEEDFSQFGEVTEFKAKVNALRAKRVSTNNAYEDYMEGEEDYGKSKPLKKIIREGFDYSIRLIKVYTGFYDISRARSLVKKPPSQALNLALINVCKALEVRTSHVLKLLELGANPNYQEGERLDTPMHWAVRRGAYLSLKYLVYAGGDPWITNNRYQNVLIEACDCKRTGSQMWIIRFLLSLKNARLKIDLRDSGGNSALLNAVFNNNVWICRELLLAGASVTHPGLKEGQTSAYDVALWIYCASLLLDIDQLPEEVLQPNGILYRFLSLKGHYEYAPLLAFQNLWKYSAELVFRMIQHKKQIEDREHYANQLRQKYQQGEDPKPVTEEKVKRIRARPVADEDLSRIQKRREYRLRKLAKNKNSSIQKQLNLWNEYRRDTARRIDKEFSHQLNGYQTSSPNDWILNEEISTIKTWKAIPKQTKGIYTTPPEVGSLNVLPITIEQMMEQTMNQIDPANPIRLIRDTKEEAYLRKTGMEPLIEEEEEEDFRDLSDEDDEEEKVKETYDRQKDGYSSQLRRLNNERQQISTHERRHNVQKVEKKKTKNQKTLSLQSGYGSQSDGDMNGDHVVEVRDTESTSSELEVEEIDNSSLESDSNASPIKIRKTRNNLKFQPKNKSKEKNNSNEKNLDFLGTKTKEVPSLEGNPRAWKLASRTSMGFVDENSTWAKEKLKGPIFIPEELSDTESDA